MRSTLATGRDEPSEFVSDFLDFYIKNYLRCDFRRVFRFLAWTYLEVTCTGALVTLRCLTDVDLDATHGASLPSQPVQFICPV